MFHEAYGGYHIKSIACFSVPEITQNGNIGLKMRDRLKIGHFWHLLRPNLSLSLSVYFSLSFAVSIDRDLCSTSKTLPRNVLTQLHSMQLIYGAITCLCISLWIEEKKHEWLSSYEEHFSLALRSLILLSESVHSGGSFESAIHLFKLI